MSTTVRITDQTHERLVAIAASSGRRLQAIVEDAVAVYEANEFWESFDSGYDVLAHDPARWEDVEAERSAEAPTLSDNLDGG